MLLFAAEGLSQLIHFAIRKGDYKVIEIAINLFISHLIFVDDILLFCDGSRGALAKLKSIMDLFLKATSMSINEHNPSIIHNGLSGAEINR